MKNVPPLIVLALALSACAHRASELDDAPASSELAAELFAEEPAALADPGQPHGVLRFELRGPGGAPVAGRLTFVRTAGEIPDLFPNVLARPHDLAVRRNVVYCLSGRAAITVPVGTYTVYATRGLEWSRVEEQLTFQAGGELSRIFELRPEVDTAGWISGDFHLHTLTHSGHGDADLNERLISLIGEGVEFAVATDHNHHTDYAPHLEELGATEAITAVVGNEVSVPVGHFNAFPLEPDRPVADPGARDAVALFEFLRAEPNRFGIVPVIQLNHPRWGGIDYFTQIALDPITGEAHSERYSADYDTLEIFNANPGWGYYDADRPGELSMGAGIHSVLRDWYNLLNRGGRYFAVGNSDSHTVREDFAGYPRNFVRCSTDVPGEIDPAEIAAELRAGHVYTTIGPIVDFTINGEPMGGRVEAIDQRVQVRVELQTPGWIRIDRLKIVRNGDVVATVELEPEEPTDGRLRWPVVERELQVPARDCWIHVTVEGDRDLAPIVDGGGRPILPLAVTNPIWIDSDGDGQWRSPWDWAQGMAAADLGISSFLPPDQRQLLPPSEAALVLLAHARAPGPQSLRTLGEGLACPERTTRLAALRAAEQLAEARLAPAIEPIFSGAGDAFLALTAARALARCDPAGSGERVVALFERFGDGPLQRYPAELEHLVSVEPVRDWKVIGYFPNGDGTTLFNSSFGPETDPDLTRIHAGKDGPVGWTDPVVTEAGYVDLGAIDPERRDRSICFAQTWLHVDGDRELPYALGSDDGCRLWLNGEELYRDTGQHGASPLQQVGTLSLVSGWNRVLIGVENGGGATGLYFRLFGDGVRVASEQS